MNQGDRCPANVRRAYGLAILYALFIFATIPYTRPFQRFVYDRFGKAYFGYAVLLAIALCLVWGLSHLVKRARRGAAPGNYAWLAGVAGAYVYFTLKLWQCPEEAIHFLEYGLLSFLCYRALSRHVRDTTVYFTASLMVLFAGTIDEFIQWIVPDRVGSFRDVWINFLAGALFQLGLWKGIRPAAISESIQPGSVRILTASGIACLVLLGLCASMTPPRVALVSERISAFSHLRNKHHMMSEYGYRHEDPEAGAFYSRFTEQELKAIDRGKQEAHAAILNAHAQKPYGDFLKAYNTITAPFLYEMRIHLFRRDQYAWKGMKEKDSAKLEYQTVAHRENLILERYFGQTLQRTVFQWPVGKKAEIETGSDRNRPYESPVSSDLITRFTEKGLWAGIGLLVCLLLAIHVRVGRLRHEAG